MNKIVFSLVCAVLFMGCTNVYVTAPNVDADTMEDGGTVLPPDASVDALMQPDSAVTADAGMDATPDVVVVPDVCAGESDCCHAGQPIHVGMACGDYPASAEASCNSTGVCETHTPQLCTDVNACCDGWAPRAGTAGAACHCVVDYNRDHPVTPWPNPLRGCINEPNDLGAGNMQGICMKEYAGNLGGHTEQYTCVSNTTWTP